MYLAIIVRNSGKSIVPLPNCQTLIPQIEILCTKHHKCYVVKKCIIAIFGHTIGIDLIDHILKLSFCRVLACNDNLLNKMIPRRITQRIEASIVKFAKIYHVIAKSGVIAMQVSLKITYPKISSQCRALWW